jgi:hypothetical protein
MLASGPERAVQLTGERYEDAATRTLAASLLNPAPAPSWLGLDPGGACDNLADKSYTLADTYATAGRLCILV